MYDSLWALSTMGGNYGPLAERVLGGGTVPSPPPTSEPSPPGPLPQVSLLGCVFFACGNISYLLLYNNSCHDKVRTVTSGKIFYDINQLPVPTGTIRILLKVLVIRILKYPHHIAGSRTATSLFGNGSGSDLLPWTVWNFFYYQLFVTDYKLDLRQYENTTSAPTTVTYR
jgi:hypothetical protein